MRILCIYAHKYPIMLLISTQHRRRLYMIFINFINASLPLGVFLCKLRHIKLAGHVVYLTVTHEPTVYEKIETGINALKV